MQKKIILTGDRPTGKLHIGHYVGSLRRRVELQNSGEFDDILIMIADAQALTDNYDNPDKVRDNIIHVALDYLSAGLDPKKAHIFIQSQVPELTELTFYYANLVTLSTLERNPTIKSEIKMRQFGDFACLKFCCILKSGLYFMWKISLWIIVQSRVSTPKASRDLSIPNWTQP